MARAMNATGLKPKEVSVEEAWFVASGRYVVIKTQNTAHKHLRANRNPPDNPNESVTQTHTNPNEKKMKIPVTYQVRLNLH